MTGPNIPFCIVEEIYLILVFLLQRLMFDFPYLDSTEISRAIEIEI